MLQGLFGPVLLLTFSFSLFASAVCKNWTESSAKKKSVETSPLQKAWENKSNDPSPPIYYEENLHCYQGHNFPLTYRPLTVVYGESGPPVSMQRITMAWHSLWINCACWHTQLTVSNSVCDLCTAAPNILLEWGHKSAAGWLTLYAIIHTLSLL